MKLAVLLLLSVPLCALCGEKPTRAELLQQQADRAAARQAALYAKIDADKAKAAQPPKPTATDRANQAAHLEKLAHQRATRQAESDAIRRLILQRMLSGK